MAVNVCRTVIIFTKFEVVQLIRCWFMTFSLLTRYVTVWPWLLNPWPWTFELYWLWCDRTLYQILAKSSNKRLNYSDLTIDDVGAGDTLNFTFGEFHDVSHIALRTGTIFAKVSLGQPIRSWLVTFFYCGYVMSSCHIDLWLFDIKSFQCIYC